MSADELITELFEMIPQPRIWQMMIANNEVSHNRAKKWMVEAEQIVKEQTKPQAEDLVFCAPLPTNKSIRTILDVTHWLSCNSINCRVATKANLLCLVFPAEANEKVINLVAWELSAATGSIFRPYEGEIRGSATVSELIKTFKEQYP
jgi:hypothetical protein